MDSANKYKRSFSSASLLHSSHEGLTSHEVSREHRKHFVHDVITMMSSELKRSAFGPLWNNDIRKTIEVTSFLEAVIVQQETTGGSPFFPADIS